MNKKWIHRLIAVVILALFLPLAIGVGAEELGVFSSSSSSSFSSYVTFYNAKTPEAGFAVKKEVENTSDLFPAPEDDEFEFTLKINGEVARDMLYTLFDADGRRIYNYEDGQTTVEDPSKLEVALKTDRYGIFILKAGQTAKFSGIMPEDTYEVTETKPDDYEITAPASGDGKVTGTVPADGTKVTFRNLYTKGKPGTLEVRKNISYPENYEVPDTPEFTFRVSIAGEPYADKDFTIKDLITGEKIDTGTTDSEGKLLLAGNTYALFEEIPSDVDYLVEELYDDELTGAGWRPVGDTEREGATSESGTVTSFSNALASFAVTKAIEGGESTDEAFTFQIVDGEGKEPFGEALSYYLYDSALQLVSPELYQTSADGIFTLQAGQKAVFVGVDTGTAYGVHEINSGSYTQLLPSGGGYDGKVVQDSVEVLPFVNGPVTEETQLTLRKTLLNETQGTDAPDVECTFQISKKTEGVDGSVEYVPAAKAAYDITDTSGTRTFQTDENGIFTLHAWETALFQGLEKGAVYRIEELSDMLPAGFTVSGEGAVEGEVGDGTVMLEIENSYNGEMLPGSGGPGVAGYLIIGAVIAAAAALILILRHRKLTGR